MGQRELEHILAEIRHERGAQDAKWGEQNHPDGTGPSMVWHPGLYAVEASTHFRRRCQIDTEAGLCTWRAIILEELAEALAENEPAKLRSELIQVAAVVAAWIEAIDRRPGD